MDTLDIRRVRVLINVKSGLRWSFSAMRGALDEFWDVPGIDLTYQFCQSAADGSEKAKRAVEEGVDTILVAGGDGTVNSVGQVLVGTNVSLGVLPLGSGNGFARHFEIPLSATRAAQSLSKAVVKHIDVGVVQNRKFFVTCSMAWDAALVRSFQKSPVRGVLPYIFAGANELIQYEPQEMSVILDSGEELSFPDALVFTVANLTQYGGGARIAPQAKEDDGRLELVVALHQDAPGLIMNLHRLFDGSVNTLPRVITRSFKSMTVKRKEATQIQIDGDLVDMPREIKVRVLPKALKVLVPG